MTIFAIGLFKKVVVADSIAPYADAVFDSAHAGVAPTFFEAWAGALAYTFQLYFDFSGYSDMAIGLARMIGIRFPMNFNSPYKAANIIDFWRRWHITLSRFLRDYLYIPLGGNRKRPSRRHVNLLVTMLLGGLWHGAAWTFVIWGGLHGVYLDRQPLLADEHRECLASSGRSCRGARRRQGLTFLAVVVAWVFFRADSFPAASTVLRSMFLANGLDAAQDPRRTAQRPRTLLVRGSSSPTGAAFPNGLVDPDAAPSGSRGLALVAWFAPNTQELMARYRPALGRPARADQARGTAGSQWRPS